MDKEKDLREHLVKMLDWHDAHAGFDAVVQDWPVELRGAKPRGAPHTAWKLLEHMRLGQWDILEFSRDAKHVSPAWPEGYWPASEAPPSKVAWEKSIKNFRRDRKAMQKLVQNPRTDLFAPIPHGDGQTIFREAVLIADHNAYHLGQLVLLRRLLGAWSG
jgi:hypothetical protein